MIKTSLRDQILAASSLDEIEGLMKQGVLSYHHASGNTRRKWETAARARAALILAVAATRKS